MYPLSIKYSKTTLSVKGSNPHIQCNDGALLTTYRDSFDEDQPPRNLIFGHARLFTPRVYNRFIPEAQFVAFFRNPVEMIRSAYEHALHSREIFGSRLTDNIQEFCASLTGDINIWLENCSIAWGYDNIFHYFAAEFVNPTELTRKLSPEIQGSNIFNFATDGGFAFEAVHYDELLPYMENAKEIIEQKFTVGQTTNYNESLLLIARRLNIRVEDMLYVEARVDRPENSAWTEEISQIVRDRIPLSYQIWETTQRIWEQQMAESFVGDELQEKLQRFEVRLNEFADCAAQEQFDGMCYDSIRIKNTVNGINQM
eukprot:UN32804